MDMRNQALVLAFFVAAALLCFCLGAVVASPVSVASKFAMDGLAVDQMYHSLMLAAAFLMYTLRFR